MKNVLFVLVICISAVFFNSCSDEADVTNVYNSYNLEEADFWEATNGPYQVDVQDIHINEKDEIFVFGNDYDYMAHDNILYKSTDAGKTWVNLFENLPEGSTVSDFEPGRSIIALNSKTKGYYQSTDMGLTWNKIIDTIPGTYYFELYDYGVKNDSKGNIFAFAPKLNNTFVSMFRSTDNGNSWTVIMDTARSLYIDNKNNLFCFSNIQDQSIIFRSTDHGDSWTEVYRGKDLYNFHIDRKGYIYINYRQISTDAGSTWKDFGKAGLYTGPFYNILYSNKGYLYMCRNTYASSEIICSRDMGKTWSLVIKTEDVKCFDIDSKGYMYVVMTHGKINRTKKPIE